MFRVVAIATLILATGWVIISRSASPAVALPSLARSDGNGSIGDFVRASPNLKDDEEKDDDSSGHGSGHGDDDNLVPVVGEIPEGSLVIEILDDDGFTPSSLTVDPGQSVTFVNRHDDDHTATGSGFDTGVIPPGGTATVILDEPGLFRFACRYHPEMSGSIGVRGADGKVPEPQPVEPAPSDATTIQIAEFAFSPATITVVAGTTVTWTNADSTPHTVTAEGGAFDSDILDPGASFSFTFAEPGTFAYFCALHPAMQATITIIAANGAAPPTVGSEPSATGSPGPDVSAAEMIPLGVSLYTRDCRDPGDIVTELEQALVMTADDLPNRVIPVAVSVTKVDVAASDLAAGDRVIVVTLADGTPVACGEIGGPIVAGEVVFGLGEVAGSGLGGVAVLHEERAGATITVYVTGDRRGDSPAAG
jgi:plastocyanin